MNSQLDALRSCYTNRSNFGRVLLLFGSYRSHNHDLLGGCENSDLWLVGYQHISVRPITWTQSCSDTRQIETCSLAWVAHLLSLFILPSIVL